MPFLDTLSVRAFGSRPRAELSRRLRSHGARAPDRPKREVRDRRPRCCGERHAIRSTLDAPLRTPALRRLVARRASCVCTRRGMRDGALYVATLPHQSVAGPPAPPRAPPPPPWSDPTSSRPLCTPPLPAPFRAAGELASTSHAAAVVGGERGRKHVVSRDSPPPPRFASCAASSDTLSACAASSPAVASSAPTPLAPSGAATTRAQRRHDVAAVAAV